MICATLEGAALQQGDKEMRGIIQREHRMKVCQAGFDRMFVIPSHHLIVIKPAVKCISRSDGAIGDPK